MSDITAAIRSCMASCAAWRRQATLLREHAALPHLRDEQRQRQRLLREAAVADRQADWWLAGATEEHRFVPKQATEAHHDGSRVHADGDD